MNEMSEMSEMSCSTVGCGELSVVRCTYCANGLSSRYSVKIGRLRSLTDARAVIHVYSRECSSVLGI